MDEKNSTPKYMEHKQRAQNGNITKERTQEYNSLSLSLSQQDLTQPIIKGIEPSTIYIPTKLIGYLGTKISIFDQNASHFQTLFSFFPSTMSKKYIEEWLSKSSSISPPKKAMTA